MMIKKPQKLEELYPFISKIPQGTHGSNKYQKKLWKIVSDYVRIRDWYDYGNCIACSQKILHWQNGQAGHYRAWSVCRGYTKFDDVNIFLECASCNTGYDSNAIGVNFKNGIIKKYGKDRLEILDNFLNNPLEKMEDYKMCELALVYLKRMKYLKEQPDYWKKVKFLL